MKKTPVMTEKKQCVLNPLSPLVAIDPEKEEQEQAERLRLGTSANSVLSRTNAMAEVIHDWGYEAKKKGKYEEAVTFFTRAIELDSFHHLYFYNRSATYSLLEMWNHAALDAQRCLELNWCCCLAWCSLIQATLQLEAFGDAMNYMDAAFDLVHEFDPMRPMLERQHELMEDLLRDPITLAIEILPVFGVDDEFGFVYTNGLHNRGHAELLAVDLPDCFLAQKLFSFLIDEKIGSGAILRRSHTFQAYGHNITILPVANECHRNIIHRELMEHAQRGCDVIVLKIEAAHPTFRTPHVCKEEADAYIRSLAIHSLNYRQSLGRGKRLVNTTSSENYWVEDSKDSWDTLSE
jgi:tetratricopeptide (TPR) repeat protein